MTKCTYTHVLVFIRWILKQDKIATFYFWNITRYPDQLNAKLGMLLPFVQMFSGLTHVRHWRHQRLPPVA